MYGGKADGKSRVLGIIKKKYHLNNIYPPSLEQLGEGGYLFHYFYYMLKKNLRRFVGYKNITYLCSVIKTKEICQQF
jgi:hypothetical protein